MKVSRKLGLGLFLHLIFLTSPVHPFSSNDNSADTKKIAAIALFSLCSNTVHEMGHALAQRYLIGAWPDTAQVGFGVGFVNNTNSANDTSVFCQFSQPCPVPDSRDDKGFHPECWGNFDTMLATGPISAMLLHLLLYHSWESFFTGETLSYLESTSKVLILLEMGNLFPIPGFTDGAKILQNIYPNASMLTKVVIVALPVIAAPTLSTQEKWLMNRFVMLSMAGLISRFGFKLW